jgi:hypothetical protein
MLAPLAAATPPAHAGLMDFLFGGKAATAAATPTGPTGQRQWRLGEFSAIRLVSRESGSPPNQHPLVIQPEVLRQQLALVRTQVKGGDEPLFTADELGGIVEPLAQALANAGEVDDVLLLSTARRDGILLPPLGVTARIFARDGALQLVLHDSRYDFVNAYIGSRVEPEFTFGSRTASGPAVLRSAAARNVRSDWLALPLTLPVVPTAAPAVAAPVPAAASPAAPPSAAAAPAPTAPAAAAPAARPEDIERRLITLQRLRDRGLISEEEYQAKRREILQQL